MTCLQEVSRVMRHTKIKEFKEKTKVVKITKRHAFLGIDFENKKIVKLKYREKLKHKSWAF